MIISPLHKFIFVAIPKTGTHSVRKALRDHMGPDDLEQVGLFVQKKFPIPELARLQHGHLSLEQVRPYLRQADFDFFSSSPSCGIRSTASSPIAHSCLGRTASSNGILTPSCAT